MRVETQPKLPIMISIHLISRLLQLILIIYTTFGWTIQDCYTHQRKYESEATALLASFSKLREQRALETKYTSQRNLLLLFV